jgi:L-ascorbate metabolism protein UlaG (beta-lactamase superfamily)
MRVWFGVLSLVVALGATIAADTIPATGGNIELTPMTHAHVQLEFGGKVIHVDPTGQSALGSAKPADIILVTDIHGDHFDPAAIEKIRKPSTIVVAPQAVAGKYTGKAEVLANGQTRTFDGVVVEAVGSYNLQRGPAAGQLFHEKGRGNGYVITLGGKRLYFSGDTECVPEIKALTKIDVAFITMNLPYTMPPEEAAACVKAFRPAMVYPYHYRGMGGPTPEQNVQAFTAAMKGFQGVEVKMANFYPAAPAAPAGGGRQGGRGGD